MSKRTDLGDEQKVNRQRNIDRINELYAQLDVRYVMATENGRRFIWRLLDICGVHSSPFAMNALLMANQCGKQEIGQWLLAEVAAVTPTEYLMMQREHQQLVQEEEAADGEARDSGEDGTDGDPD